MKHSSFQSSFDLESVWFFYVVFNSLVSSISFSIAVVFMYWFIRFHFVMWFSFIPIKWGFLLSSLVPFFLLMVFVHLFFSEAYRVAFFFFFKDMSSIFNWVLSYSTGSLKGLTNTAHVCSIFWLWFQENKDWQLIISLRVSLLQHWKNTVITDTDPWTCLQLFLLQLFSLF